MKRFTVILLAMLFMSPSLYAATPGMIDPAHGVLTLLTFFGLGVLLAFTPCVFPMVPILSGIIVGQKKPTTWSTLKLSLVFVLSMALTYAVAGVVAGYLGSTIQTLLQKPAIIVSFSLIFVVMALSMFGWFDLKIPSFLQNKVQALSSQQQSGSLLGVAAMGVLATLIASPCVTAPLISVLTYIGETGHAALGGLILFSLALGMGVPLLLFGLGEGLLLPKAGGWMHQIKALFGVMMLGVAIWMLSRLVSIHVTLLMTAALIIVSAIAFGALDFKASLSRLQRGLSFCALVYGIILMIGAAQGSDHLWLPLQSGSAAPVLTHAQTAKPVGELFQVVKTEAALHEALSAAAAKHQPAIVDFWAGWCPDCRALDEGVLAKLDVQELMEPYALIRVDITQDSDELKRMRQEYKVYGIPTFVFYNAAGQLVPSQGLSGEITTLSFSRTLKALVA